MSARSSPRLLVRLCIAQLALASAFAGSAFADPGPGVRVVASERYKKGRVHRFFFGGGYRALWEAEIELPLLDLEAEGGGLTATERFGGLQTAVLGFEGRDGRTYSFRGTDKDPSAVLPEVLRDSFVGNIVQDQMAAQHPGGPVAAGIIAEAAGVLTIQERLVVMPDDPALGEFREEFAGMVGAFYEYPEPASEGRSGFHGATELIDHEELYERLKRSNQDHVWTEAFLRARLVDMLIGDFDRHRKQWRWVKIPGESRWQPIPEDRDQAFVRYGGLGARMARFGVPILQRYGPEYPDIFGLTLHGWEQDRWLLAGHEWKDWEAVALDVRARLSDEVIDRAIAALPKEYAAIDGDRLRSDIRGRRDTLLQGARSFYDHLAGEVDVQTSSAADRVRAEWSEDGRLLIEVRAMESASPWFSRSFDPRETRDVRLYLRDGDDVVTVRGPPGLILLRVIAGGGRKTIDDSAAGDTLIYDQKGLSIVKAGPGTEVVPDVYVLPPSESGFVDVKDVPPRDWGSDLHIVPQLSYEKDVGILVGLGVDHTLFGFRKHPWASRYLVSAAFATEAREPLLEFTGTLHPESSKLRIHLGVHYSGIEMLRFYGFGNETKADREGRDYRVLNREVELTLRVGRTFLDEKLQISGGLWLEYSATETGDRLIDELRPLGTPGFGSVGGVVALSLDTRSSVQDPKALGLSIHHNPAKGYPTGGARLDLEARVSPGLWDAPEFWGGVEGSLAAYFSFFDEGRLVLALRAGGEVTFGAVPYFAAAYLGGGRMFRDHATVRGLRAQRFAGDAAVFGNADLRLFLFRAKILLPIDFGLFGFGDLGRVFVRGEHSSAWHPSAGGGLWLAPLGRANTFSASVAVGEEEILFYFRTGFHY